MADSVLFVHDGPIYHCGSTGRYYGLHYDDALIERYRRLGENVSFLMRVNPIEAGETKGFSPVTARSFTVVPIPNFKSLKTYVADKPKAAKLIREVVEAHDIVVVRLPSAAGALAYHEALRQRKPVLVEMVACTYDALWNYDWRGKVMAHYKLWYYRGLLLGAPWVLYVTHRFLQDRYPSRGRSIGCSDVSLPPAHENQLADRVATIRSRDASRPLVLGTIAALDVPYKGQLDVIEALGKLKKRGHHYIYRLVGQGSSTAILNAARKHDVEDAVEVVGPLPHNEIHAFLQSIDLYIQPSKTEGLPRSVIEAMAAACPCLGSNVGGIPELLDESSMFKAGDIGMIVSKLAAVDQAWLVENATHTFEKAKEYQPTVLAEKRNAFYDTFLKSSEPFI